MKPGGEAAPAASAVGHLMAFPGQLHPPLANLSAIQYSAFPVHICGSTTIR
jgi:hypothetical protein